MALVGLTLGRTEPEGLDPSQMRPIGPALWASSARSTRATAQLIVLLEIRKNHLKNKADTTNLLLLDKHENNTTNKTNS
jgi:hypothetical protein